MRRNAPIAGEERRGLSLADAGIATTNEGRFTGYSAVFNTRTAIGNPRTWGFFEEIAPGAFTKTIAEGDQRFLINHNTDLVVSRVSAGTLTLSQDERGLLADSALDDDLSYVRDLKVNLRNRNITGQSFGFMVPDGKDEWRTETLLNEDGSSVDVEVRTVREAKVLETSSCTFPAYDETTAGLRHSLVPALLHRGDSEAIKRAAMYRPDLAQLLGYDPDRQPVRIDLSPGTFTGAVTPAAPPAALVTTAIPQAQTEPVDATCAAPAQDPHAGGAPTAAATQTTEPVDATRDSTTPDTPADGGDPVDSAETTSTATSGVEPAVPTREAPSQHDLAKARSAYLKSVMNRQRQAV